MQLKLVMKIIWKINKNYLEFQLNWSQEFFWSHSISPNISAHLRPCHSPTTHTTRFNLMLQTNTSKPSLSYIPRIVVVLEPPLPQLGAIYLNNCMLDGAMWLQRDSQRRLSNTFLYDIGAIMQINASFSMVSISRSLQEFACCSPDSQFHTNTRIGPNGSIWEEKFWFVELL